jgi:hypothetical protein
MIASTNEDSIYIKAKESMLDYLNDSDLSSREKAQMLSDLISKLALEISSSALNGAIKIAMENQQNDYTIGKMHEDILMSMQQRDKIATDIEKMEIEKDIAETNKIHASIQNWDLQSKLYRNEGIDTRGLDPLVNTYLPSTINFDMRGISYFEESVKRTEGLSTLSQMVRNYGVMNFEFDEYGAQLTGVTQIQGDNTDANDSTWNGLVRQQYNVAKRQETGFDDNMRQHAANSSANMIGLLVSSDAVTEDVYTKPLEMWMRSMGYLNECSPEWSCPDQG